MQAQQVKVQQSFVGYSDVESLEIVQGGAMVISAAEATVTQGGATVLLANNVMIQEGGAGIVMARQVKGPARTGVLLAGEVEGPIETILDTRGALLFGIAAGAAIGAVILIGKLLRKS